jgi:hypothetical protein
LKEKSGTKGIWREGEQERSRMRMGGSGQKKGRVRKKEKHVRHTVERRKKV